MAEKKSLPERLEEMANERGLPEEMQETAREALELIGDGGELEPLKNLVHELDGMVLDGTSWPKQLEYVRDVCRRAFG